MIGRITQELVGKLSQKTSLFGRFSTPAASKSDHYTSSISSAASLKVAKAAVCEAASAGGLSKTKSTVYQYEIITEEE